MTKTNKENTAASVKDAAHDFTADEEQKLDAAARGEEVDVVIEDDSDDDGTGIEGGAAAAKELQEAVEPSVEDLKKKLAEANAAREAAEARAADSDTNKSQAKNAAIEAAEARLALAEQNLAKDKDAVNNEIVELRRKLREAKDNADTEKETEISEAMFDAKIKLAKLQDNEVGLTNFRQRFEVDKKKALETTDDQNGEYLTDRQLADYTPQAQKWIKQHDEFRNSAAFRDKAIKAHHGALYKGIKADTPEYFEYLETETGLRQPEVDVQVDDATDANVDTPPTPPAKPKAPIKKPLTTTPPSRMGGNNSPTNGGRFRQLTAEEVEAAEISGMSVDEYRIEKYGK